MAFQTHLLAEQFLFFVWWLGLFPRDSQDLIMTRMLSFNSPTFFCLHIYSLWYKRAKLLDAGKGQFNSELDLTWKADPSSTVRGTIKLIARDVVWRRTFGLSLDPPSVCCEHWCTYRVFSGTMTAATWTQNVFEFKWWLHKVWLLKTEHTVVSVCSRGNSRESL